MKILSLNIFNLLRSRNSRLKRMLKKEESKKELDLEWGGVDRTRYTMVEQVPGGRKPDLLATTHLNGKQIGQATHGNKTGKARWHVNCTEQEYKPKEIKLNPQLEYMHDELGLSKDQGASTELRPGF